MSSFYLYYAYGLETEEITVSSPYYDFATNDLILTLAKPVYVSDSFVGVVGTDIPLSELVNAIGDVTIG